ncbi:NAD(P)-binding domain-containing protein [Nocardioides sp. SYSU D00038]|uniref:imine reductase family protein n=1 Tax=Nocardioides sp. SYSU D00038 TaxID=2812554 RepID=UPI0019679531|nr:NAD(P)-binding domain-containing protein [Nocardioides sp. SYSU D00038]
MSSAQPDPQSPHTIAVLGLGAMGVAIAEAVARAGHRVRAWNRSPRGFEGDDGGRVEVAATVAEAVAGADVVVVCVRDHPAARELLAAVAAVPGPTGEGRVVLNVSTGSPAEAVETAAQAGDLGLRYVTGAVMVPTPMVGSADCVVLYAGAAADLAVLGPLQEALGGHADATGADHAVPPALDLAMLDIYFSGMYAHLHATALAAAHGIPAARFLPYADGIVETLRGSLAGLSDAVVRRTYETGEARLDMCLAFLDHIVSASHEAGLPAGPAGLVRDASARALEAWPGSTDWDVVAEGLTPSAAPVRG